MAWTSIIQCGRASYGLRSDVALARALCTPENGTHSLAFLQVMHAVLPDLILMLKPNSRYPCRLDDHIEHC